MGKCGKRDLEPQNPHGFGCCGSGGRGPAARHRHRPLSRHAGSVAMGSVPARVWVSPSESVSQGDGEGGKELQKVTESPQQKGINGNKKKRGREGAGQRPAGTAGGLFALLLGNGEGFASLPQSSAPNAGFGARAARFAGPLPRCQACHFCPCSPQEGFGDSPPMASSCLGWGQLRTAVLSPLGALPRRDRWLKALGIQQSGRKWEKMGAEGGGQAPAGLSPSPLQEADAPDQ